MILKLKLASLFLIIYSNIYCQNVQWGDPLRIQKNTIVKTVVKNNSNFFIVRSINTKKQKGIFIEKYNSENLACEKNQFFSYPNVGNHEFEKILLIKNDIYWFYSTYNRSTKVHELFYVKIASDLITISEPFKIDSYNIGESKSIPGFSIHASENNKYYLVIRKYPFDKYANEKYFLTMMDSNLTAKWQKEIEIPYANNLFDINEKMIDLKGNIHFLATLSPEKEKGDFFSRRISTNKYLLISYYPYENKLKEFDINLDGKYVTSVTAGVNPAGNIAIGGFYSNTNEFALAGTFYFLFSPDSKKIISINQKPFEKAFMMEFMSEKSASKGEELNDFYFDHFLLNKDGSAIMVAEEYYRQTYTYYDAYNQLYYNNNTYNFNAVIVVKVNQKGEIVWSKKINKRQISNAGNNEYYSYSLAKTDSTLTIVYNDHYSNLKDKNIDSEKITSLTNAKFSSPTKITVSNSGITQKELFYEVDKNNLILVPSLCRQLDDNTYLITRQKRGTVQFGILKLK